MLAPGVVDAAALVGRAEPRGRLLDINVREDLGGCVGRLGRRLVLVDVEGDAGQADALAGEVADALEGEEGVCAAGEGLVLCYRALLALGLRRG